MERRTFLAVVSGGLLADTTEAVGHTAGCRVRSLPVQRPADFRNAFVKASRERADGVVVLSSPLINEQRSQIVALAPKNRLPTISLFTSFPASGTLMAYGPNLQDLYRRAPTFVDKILKGDRPSDLPIERPTKSEVVINLKAAKALGLTIPPALLARSDQVIE